MLFSGKADSAIRAVLCSLALMLFPFFIPYKFPLKLIAFTSLLGVGIIISLELKSWSDLEKIIGKVHDRFRFFLFMVAGVILGISVSALYRWHLDVSLFPRTLFPFAIVAALIGSAEELVFRGFIQEQARHVNGCFSVFFGSLSHTGYKICLFLSPALIHHVDIGFLAICTFTAGILLGVIRYTSGSVWPSVAAHALFDILVYGENAISPWWVW